MSAQVLFERRGRVVIATLNRPEALNALNSEIMRLLSTEFGALDADPGVGCFVVTGSAKAFAAGADIKEMVDLQYTDVFLSDPFNGWEAFARLRTPVVAAVAGYALGGGCELAMMCDVVIAATTATFGQPEIKLGVIPGMGGSQRLIRAVGKAKASDMILTGRNMDAEEAERCGLVARVVPPEKLLDEAIAVAETIAAQGKIAAVTAKDAMRASFETPLAEGIRYERRIFHALFATEDQSEGMKAFIEKRAPKFKGR
ncbi:MAG: enoyl-CoA hydratase [Rhizobiales bacterium]|nr:enoyl-CoA hydratase [Hyphomicrobiales bacterium]